MGCWGSGWWSWLVSGLATTYQASKEKDFKPWQVVFTIMCLEWLFTYICKPPADKPWDIFGWNTILIEDEKSVWNQFRKAELQELPGYRQESLVDVYLFKAVEFLFLSLKIERILLSDIYFFHVSLG